MWVEKQLDHPWSDQVKNEVWEETEAARAWEFDENHSMMEGDYVFDGKMQHNGSDCGARLITSMARTIALQRNGVGQILAFYNPILNQKWFVYDNIPVSLKRRFNITNADVPSMIRDELDGIWNYTLVVYEPEMFSVVENHSDLNDRLMVMDYFKSSRKRNKGKLSKESLELLSIPSYMTPKTRAFIRDTLQIPLK